MRVEVKDPSDYQVGWKQELKYTVSIRRFALGMPQSPGKCLTEAASYLTGIRQPWSTKLQENRVFPLLTKASH